jgi:hypothetical protein
MRLPVSHDLSPFLIAVAAGDAAAFVKNLLQPARSERPIGRLYEVAGEPFQAAR